MKKLMKDFKEFAFKGSVLDMAVGIMIGGAISTIVKSLVNDIFMPIIGLLTNGIDLNNLFFALDGNTYVTVDAAKAAGAATINYGTFLTSIVDFLLMAVCIFIVLKIIVRVKSAKSILGIAEEKKEEPRKCPYCCQIIDKEATRCPHCTSELPVEEGVK